MKPSKIAEQYLNCLENTSVGESRDNYGSIESLLHRNDEKKKRKHI